MTRRGRWWTLTIAAVVLLTTGALVAWVRGNTSSTADAPLLEAQVVSVGGIEVTMTPVQLDEAGARFRLSLDTHSGSLDIDLPDAAELRIAGATADVGAWDGGGPGGHHREGTLRFVTPVTSGASVELRVSGLPGVAVGTWTAP